MTNPREGRSARILLLIAGLPLVLASCGGADNGQANTSLPTSVAPPTGSPEPSPSPAEDESPMSLEDVAAEALKAVDGSSLLTIETEQGRTVWEATVVTGNGTEHEMLISADDGELVDGPTKKADDREDKAENRARVRSAELDYKEAAAAISRVVPDARLLELNLDGFDGRITAWEGDLYADNGIRYSVKIDARTGDVLDKDTDAEDDD